ncbi:hypothetical protein Bca52824_015443 [Brassica carinata]|uniref:Uncharacterized protein n=1 Tax=Brassica carinata TaxID=52824 RepID=A0A8X7W4M0_BRACI|nr:hypothetical protein Bca52824_015443 [Brassica carinata]
MIDDTTRDVDKEEEEPDMEELKRVVGARANLPHIAVSICPHPPLLSVEWMLLLSLVVNTHKCDQGRAIGSPMSSSSDPSRTGGMERKKKGAPIKFLVPLIYAPALLSFACP